MNNYNRYEINPFIFSTRHYVLAEYANFYLPPLVYIGPEKWADRAFEFKIVAHAPIDQIQHAYDLNAVTNIEVGDETANVPLIQYASAQGPISLSGALKLPSVAGFRIDLDSSLNLINNTVLKIYDSTNNENHGVKITDDLNKDQFVFDGVNDYIRVLNDIFESDQDFTIQLWCALDIPNASQILIGSGQAPPDPCLLLYSNTSLGSADQQIRVFAESSEKLVGSDITEADGTLITLTRGGGTWKLYENGLIVATETEDYDLIGNDLVIGGHLFLDDLYKGTIKSVQVSDVVRSAEWIYLDYLSQNQELLIYSDIEDEFFIIADYSILYCIGKIRHRNLKVRYSLRAKINEANQIVYDLEEVTASNEISEIIKIAYDIQETTVITDVFQLTKIIYNIFEAVINNDLSVTYNLNLQTDTEIIYSLVKSASRTLNINYSLFTDVIADTKVRYTLIPEKTVRKNTKVVYSLRTDQFMWSNPTFILQIEGDK